jgi:hypothetical protein
VVNEVTVTRARHPLAGQRLQVIGAMRKLGRDELLVVLSDGSKTLMPAAWTDRDIATADQGQALGQATPVLAAPADLLHACELVSSLRVRTDASLGQAARKPSCEEDADRAACPAELDTRTDPGPATRGDHVAAPGSGRCGDQGPGPADRSRRRSGDVGSRR